MTKLDQIDRVRTVEHVHVWNVRIQSLVGWIGIIYEKYEHTEYTFDFTSPC